MAGAEEDVAVVGPAAVSERRSLPPLRAAIPAVIGAWALVLEIPRFVAMVQHDPAVTDFRLFYVAAQIGRTSGWSGIYDPGRQHAASLIFGQADAVITPSYTYLNPPLLALLVAPLTAVPLSAAFYIWTVVNIAAFVTAWLMAAPGAGVGRVALLLVSLALWPSIFSIERGQPVLLAYALAIGCWWMAARRREVEAGILLAVALAIKPQDVALLPAVLLLCGFRRADRTDRDGHVPCRQCVGRIGPRLHRQPACCSFRSRGVAVRRPGRARRRGARRRVAPEALMECRLCDRARGHAGFGGPRP